MPKTLPTTERERERGRVAAQLRPLKDRLYELTRTRANAILAGTPVQAETIIEIETIKARIREIEGRLSEAGGPKKLRRRQDARRPTGQDLEDRIIAVHPAAKGPPPNRFCRKCGRMLRDPYRDSACRRWACRGFTTPRAKKGGP